MKTMQFDKKTTLYTEWIGKKSSQEYAIIRRDHPFDMYAKFAYVCVCVSEGYK